MPAQVQIEVVTSRKRAAGGKFGGRAARHGFHQRIALLLTERFQPRSEQQSQLPGRPERQSFTDQRGPWHAADVSGRDEHSTFGHASWRTTLLLSMRPRGPVLHGPWSNRRRREIVAQHPTITVPFDEQLYVALSSLTEGESFDIAWRKWH